MSPILTADAFDIVTHSPAQTYAIGRRLGQLLQEGDVVCLEGDLGTGKTCLTQGIGAGLQVTGVINSPTFVFVNEYAPSGSGPCLYHVDLYRVGSYLEIMGLGLEDYIYGNGVTVIEWADRAREYIPPERLWIKLGYTDHMKRSLFLEATGTHYIEVVNTLKRDVYGAPTSD
ncbi:MAG: tRNA (adenosine(37)-N6)-threonylcarbamoyltransferase complex ATPase subunit type 1 TsaE [Anaerolineae bacterium]|nr:tRNA (adenosine(37)-N6)-threonylcarbamoyltransferase complex ATPase subunit type 1 TsaE [Chloroflexota bacterium]